MSGMQPVRVVEEDAEVVGQGSGLSEHMPECGCAGTVRMRSLGGLGQLKWVAEQHEVSAVAPTARALARENCPASSMIR